MVVFRGNEHGGHTAQRLDAERERSHVEQQHVLHLAAQHAALDRGADGHDLVGIHRLVGLLAEVVLHDLLDLRNPGRATDQDHFVDLLGIEPRILERLLHRRNGPLDQVVHQLLELGPGQTDVEVLGPRLVGRDERQVDVGLLGASTAPSWPSRRLP